MTRLSTVDQLPEPIRAEIGRLRTQGCTIDQIVAHLRTLYGSTPSRSALGRHIQGLDKLGEKMRRSRDVAAALVRELGDAPESTAARLNIELIHSAVLDLFMRAGDGDTVDEGGKAALDGNPEGVMMLAKALDHLSRASKTNVDFVAAAEKRAAERTKKEAAVAVETVAKARGISGDTLEAIKAGIFGVRAA
jgi:hypothetical protein